MFEPDLQDTSTAGDRALRQFAGAWLGVMGAIAVWSAVHGHGRRALVLGGLALTVGLSGLRRPASVRWLYALAVGLTRPVGAVLNRVLLAIMFYCVFTPLALVFRLLGRDALRLKRPEGAVTYWIRRRPSTDVRRYLRQ